MTRIDADTGEVTRTIRANAAGRGITVGGGLVWVTDETTGNVRGIDPATNLVTSTAPAGSDPIGIAYGAGSLWVANALDDTVSRLDATTLGSERTIPVPGGPSSIAFTRGAVWVTSEFGSRVVRIDPRRNIVVGSTPTGNRPEGLAVGDEGVWVATRASGDGHRGGRLLVLGGGVDSIDPAIADTTDSVPLLGNAYDGLTALRRTGGAAGTQLLPDLAAALPRPTESGTSYTFRLRPGIRYSDGSPLRAADFRRALMRDLELNSPWAPPFAHLAGADACSRHRRCDLSRSVIVEGPSTLTFRLPARDPRLFWELAKLTPIPAGTPLRDVGTRPIPSTGPYTIESYRPGHLVTFVRNPYFHVWSAAARPDGYPDEIAYRMTTREGAAIRDVLAGRADILYQGDLSGDLVQRLSAHQPLQLHLDAQQATTYVFLNVRRPPFDDIRVRRALDYAVDRARVVALHGAGLAQPTCQLVPPTDPGYREYCPYTAAPDSGGEWKAPDLAKAQALIRASGTRGQTIVVWSFSYFQRESRYFVALLRRLGYRARLHYVGGHRRLLHGAGAHSDRAGRLRRRLRRPTRCRHARRSRLPLSRLGLDALLRPARRLATRATRPGPARPRLHGRTGCDDRPRGHRRGAGDPALHTAASRHHLETRRQLRRTRWVRAVRPALGSLAAAAGERFARRPAHAYAAWKPRGSLTTSGERIPRARRSGRR